ncbi:hypothetical protein [Limnohabitans sp. Rim8]|uniref:hypothetical protein n=1 Tax=Limnohabitans sp. Rim8 TaxID=1100718 RepID=UPI0025D17B41|nr:hypothetical protein [Limnohabitans sp. Rim8]
MPTVCQVLSPVAGAAAPALPEVVASAVLLLGAATAPELSGTVIMLVFIVAVAVAMVCSL